MKWIKVAIGALIAVMSIGIIATSVYKMTQSSEVIREVSFEIDYDEGTYSPISVYNDILEYSVINYKSEVQNVLVYIDDEIAPEVFIIIANPVKILFIGDLPDGGLIDSYITDDGSWYNDGGELTYDITVKLVFEVTQPPQLTGINATLILLIPLVFVGGLLLYFYKPLKKD